MMAASAWRQMVGCVRSQVFVSFSCPGEACCAGGLLVMVGGGEAWLGACLGCICELAGPATCEESIRSRIARAVAATLRLERLSVIMVSWSEDYPDVVGFGLSKSGQNRGFRLG